MFPGARLGARAAAPRHGTCARPRRAAAGGRARYPQNWGLRGPDRIIDHRRVPNLLFSTFLGGSACGGVFHEECHDIAVDDASGVVTVVGHTTSTDFSVLDPLQAFRGPAMRSS